MVAAFAKASADQGSVEAGNRRIWLRGGSGVTGSTDVTDKSGV